MLNHARWRLVYMMLWMIFAGGAGSPAWSQQPITLSVIDAGGDLESTKVIIENYRKAFPNKVKDIKYQLSPSTQVTSKVKAQQDAGRLDINLILTGQTGGFVLAANNQLIKLFPTYEKLFPKDEMTDVGKVLQDAAEGFLLPSVGNAGGPVFVYNPKKVSSPPKTADELLAWAKANPGRLIYPRPAGSGPGRVMMLGMPFILGDKGPMDPEKGWAKAWAYLQELSKYVEYYPPGTVFMLKEFAQDQRWMYPAVMEWDLKPRADGMIPIESKVAILENTTFIVDGHYWGIPKGVPQAEVEVILDLMKFMRRPEQQVLTWQAFQGPIIKAATLDKTPPDLRKYVESVQRPEYREIGRKWKIAPPVGVNAMTYAFDRWDREVGAQKIQK